MGNLQPYVGLDAGTARVHNGKGSEQINQGYGYMSGWALGIRNNSQLIGFDLSYAQPIKSPSFMSNSKEQFYFTINTKIRF